MTPTSSKTTEAPPTKPVRRILGVGLAAVVVVGVALAIVYLFGRTEPAEVDLDTTVIAVAQSTVAPSGTQSASSSLGPPLETRPGSVPT